MRPYLLLLLLTTFGLACSRDTNRIWVKLEQPMYNRFHFRLPGEEHQAIDLAPSEQTVLFDTEQMTTVEVSVRGGDVQHRRSEFRIALVDYNNNGQFNEAGIDKYLLEKYGRDTSLLIYPLQPNLNPLQPYTQFRVDSQLFEIDFIDPEGQSLEIYPIGRSDVVQPAIFNTQIPNLQVRDSLGKNIRLTDLQEAGKALVIVLWQNRHHIWDEKVDQLLQIHQQNPKNLTIIGLHVPGTYFRHPNLESIHGWLKGRLPLYWGENDHPRELNSNDQFPNLILYDADGVWQGSGLRSQDILEWR